MSLSLAIPTKAQSTWALFLLESGYKSILKSIIQL